MPLVHKSTPLQTNSGCRMSKSSLALFLPALILNHLPVKPAKLFLSTGLPEEEGQLLCHFGEI